MQRKYIWMILNVLVNELQVISATLQRADFLGRSFPLCEGSTCSNNVFGGLPVCHCDDVCGAFGDCCFDKYNETMMDGNQTHNKENTFFGDKKVPEKHKLIFLKYLLSSSCVKVKCKPNYFAVRAISTCPADSSVALQERCEKTTENTINRSPVSLKYVYEMHIVFKNIYCALCNGFTRKDIYRWNLYASCSKDMVVPRSTEVLANSIENTCKEFGYYSPEVLKPYPIRHCIYYKRPLCPSPINNFTEELCNSYVAPVEYNSEIYKNAHCAICDSTEQAGSFGCMKYVEFSSVQKTSSIASEGSFTGLSLLFRFDDDSNGWQTHITDKVFCSEDKVFHGNEKRCKDLVCPPSFRASYGKCVEDPYALLESYENIPFDSSGQRKSNLTLVIDAHSKDDHINLSTQLTSNIIHTLTTACKSCKTDSFRTLDQTKLEIASDLVENMGIHMIVDILRNATREISNINHYNISLWNYDFKGRLYCTKTPSQTFSKISIQNADNKRTLIKPKSSKLRISLESSRFLLAFRGPPFALDTMSSNVTVCKEPPLELSCRLLSYSVGEFIAVNDSVYLVSDSNRSVDVFELRNDVLYVCQDEFTSNNDDNVFLIVSSAILIFSIVSLLMLIIVHRIFPELLNHHGKNLVSFSTALLCGQLLFLVSIYVEGLFCSVAAVLQHYFWLCSFLWSSIMAFDLTRTFNVKSLISTHSSSRFRRYSIFAWGFPLLVVCICIALELSDILETSVYGKATICWIIKKEIIIFAFIVPTCACQLFGILCFCITLYGIEKTKHMQKYVRNSQHRPCHCLLYAKIAVLLGLTWTLEYVSALYTSEPLKYVCMIINGMQGFFIMVGYFLSTKMMKLVKSRFQSPWSAMEIPERNSTSTSKQSSEPKVTM